VWVSCSLLLKRRSLQVLIPRILRPARRLFRAHRATRRLVIAPRVLRHFPGLSVAVAQRLLARAAHLILGALRKARRCQGGHRKPESERRSRVFVHTNHDRLPLNSPTRRQQCTPSQMVGCAALHSCNPACGNSREPLQNCHLRGRRVECLSFSCFTIFSISLPIATVVEWFNGLLGPRPSSLRARYFRISQP
jgi:hypothetical protein